jgi:hypothetical protein
VQSYNDQPGAALLTDDEVRDYRVYLTGTKGYTLMGICDQAATVNAYLAPIRAIVRGPGSNTQGRGVKQV